MSVTVSEALTYGAAELKENCEDYLFEARILLCFALKVDASFLIAHADKVLSRKERELFEQCVIRRKNNEPYAYITGEAEFYGQRFFVTPDVLIPRPETELLVELACKNLQRREEGVLSVLELGTGSGCIPVSMALLCKKEGLDVEFIAVEKSVPAYEIAKKNIATYDLLDTISLQCQDWKDFFVSNQKKFDVVVSNPPYVEDSYRHESIACEPEGALFSGADGLGAIKELLQFVPSALKPGAHFFCEIGHAQGEAIKTLVSASVHIHKDVAGHDRIAEVIFSL